MSKALNIGRFLAREYIDMNSPATNLKIQKLLYFAWIEHYKQTCSDGSPKYLFYDPIMAWKLGPVVPDVYREFAIFSAMPITFADEPVGLSDNEKIFLRRFAHDNRDRTASKLVSASHRDGSPWKRTYSPGQHDKQIPFELIIELECR